MILSDEGIRRALESGEIEISPSPEKDHYSPSAVDILLGAADHFRCWKSELTGAKGVRVVLNLAEQDYHSTARGYLEVFKPEKDGSIIIPPYSQVPQLILCQTLQRLHLRPESRLAARVEGRSSLARLGLMVHMTAPTIHATFNATITLEMVNHGPFHLQLIPEKTRICQFIFERLESVPEKALDSAFQGQTGPEGTRKQR